MKKILFNLAALLALTHVACATQLPEDSDELQTQAVDVDRWMEESGAWKARAMYTFHAGLKGAVQEYSPDRLEAVMSVLRETGLWDKCSENNMDITIMMVFMKNYPLDILPSSVDWLKDMEFWEEISVHHLTLFFRAVEECPSPRREEILNWLGVNVVVKDPFSSSMSDLIKRLGCFHSRCFQPALDWVVEKGALKKCECVSEIDELFQFLNTNFGQRRFQKLFVLMEETGIWEKCDTGRSFLSLYRTIDRFEKRRLRILVDRLKENGLWYRCRSNRELEILFETLKDYEDELLVIDIAWVKETGFWDAQFSDPDQVYGQEDLRAVTVREICGLLSRVQKCTPIQRSIILPWMRDPHIMEACSIWGGFKFEELLGTLCAYDAEKIAPALAWVKESGAFEANGKGSELYLTDTVLSFSGGRLVSLEKWMKESGAWDMCATSGSNALANLLYSLKNYSDEGLLELGNWMKDSGLWAKCDGEVLSMVMEDLQYPPLPLFKKAEGWFKKLEIWETAAAAELSEKLKKLKKSQHGLRWIVSLEMLMDQYDQWRRIGDVSALREFIINSL